MSTQSTGCTTCILKMYIFVNDDLNMTPGKIASQVSHITRIVTEELVQNGYEKFPPSAEYINYMIWKHNPTTIIFKATGNELVELLKMPNSRAFYDTGKTTQVESGSLTVVGFLPVNDMTNAFKKFRIIS